MADDGKPICKYGTGCYQKNPTHKAKFSHPWQSPIIADETENFPNRRDRSSSPVDNDVQPPPRKVLRTRTSQKKQSDEISPDLNTTPSDKKQNSPRIAAHSIEKSVEGPSQMQDLDFINNCYEQSTPYSQRVEYKEMLKDVSVFIKHKFLVDMPTDFYAFWEFCKLNARKEEPVENIFKSFGIRLIGPFDVLSGKFENARMFEPGSYLRHCRYYYDPPEFQTVLHLEKTGLHYGYWRDSPKEVSHCLMAKNDVNKGCAITMFADNMFSAVMHILDKDVALTPFNRAKVTTMKKLIEGYATSKNINLNTFSVANRARNLTVVTKTFHTAGLVVPLDRKTQIGYRELIETNADLIKILVPLGKEDLTERELNAVMEKLQPLITAANIAVDECDFGNSIELGLDLFCNGSKRLHPVLLQLLVNGYSMVGRPQFIAIIKAHLEQRKMGLDMSIL